MSEPRRSVPFLRLAWRNAHRSVRRTALTASAVMVAAAAVVFGRGYMRGALGNISDTFWRTETGHVRVRREGFTARERSLPAYLSIPGAVDLARDLARLPGVRAAVPRVRSFALVDGAGANRGGVLLGLDLALEADFWRPQGMLVAGRLPAQGRAEALVGEGIARKLGVGVGDSLTLLVQTSYRSLGGLRVAVAGLARSGMAYLDNAMLVVALDQAQSMLDLEGGATEVLVFSDDADDTDVVRVRVQEAVRGRISGGAEVRAWWEQSQLMRLLASSDTMMAIVWGLLLLMAGLVVVNTMLMAVMERTREFGTQAALGMRRADLVRLVVEEGAVIGALGGAVGAAIGSAITLYLGVTGIDFSAYSRAMALPFSPVVYPAWTWTDALGSVALGALAAGLAALVPARRAARLQPAEALRT
jgi:putative ABC transport system permease protein